MGIDIVEEAAAVNFVDLGSGVGKLVAQAFLEWPAVRHAVGIELSAVRCAQARAAWTSLVASGNARALRASALATAGDSDASGGPRDENESVAFLEGDLLELDVSKATHVYVASLCFDDDLLRALAERLASRGAPRLRAVATLRPFPKGLIGFDKSDSVWAEMTWTGPEGTQVHLYTRKLEVE